MERLLKRSRCYIILAEILPIQRKTLFHLNRLSRRYVTGTLPIRLTINRRGLIWRMFRRMCISKALWDFFGGFGVHVYLNLIRTRLADRSMIDWLIDWWCFTPYRQYFSLIMADEWSEHYTVYQSCENRICRFYRREFVWDTERLDLKNHFNLPP